MHCRSFLTLLMLTNILASHSFADPTDSTSQSLEIFNDSNLIEPSILDGELVTQHSDIAKSAVGLHANSGTELFCSGTLIAKNLVLTAAHCLRSSPNLKDIMIMNWRTALVATVVNIKVHPNFYLERVGEKGIRPVWDLALIRIQPLAAHKARPALLPTTELVLKKTRAILAGFGRNVWNEENPGILYSAPVKVSKSPFPRQLISEGESVIGPGDSGGPVFLKTPKGLMVIGVHSWSGSGFPSVSESVSENLPWILRSIQELRSTQDI